MNWLCAVCVQVFEWVWASDLVCVHACECACTFVSVPTCMWVCMCTPHKVTPNYFFDGSSCLISSWRSFFTDALTFSSFQYFSGIIPENRFKGERCRRLLCVSWCSLFCSSSLTTCLGGSEVTLDTSSVGEGLQLSKSISPLSAWLFLGYSLLTCFTDPSASSESAIYSLSVGDNEALLRLGVHFPILCCTACVSLFSGFSLEELLSSSLEEADRQGDLKYFMWEPWCCKPKSTGFWSLRHAALKPKWFMWLLAVWLMQPQKNIEAQGTPCLQSERLKKYTNLVRAFRDELNKCTVNHLLFILGKHVSGATKTRTLWSVL